MSNKRIKKRLEQIFDNLLQTESQTPQTKTGAVAPVILEQKRVPPDLKPASEAIKQLKGRRPSRKTGTRPLGPIPQALASAELTGPTTTLTVPFRTETNNWAILEVKSPQVDRLWSQEEQTLVKQVTDQLSLALENARLFQQTQQLANELQVLNELGRELSAQLDLSSVVEAIYKHTSRLMETDTFFISLFSSETQQVTYPFVVHNYRRVTLPDRPIANGLPDYVLRTRTPLLVYENVMDEIKSLELEYIPFWEEEEPLCWLGVPLLLGEKILGTIVVQSNKQSHLYDEHHLGLLISIANQAATAIQNVQLFEETQKHGSEVEILNDMARAMSRSLNRDEIVENIYQYATRLLDTNSFFIALYNAEEDSVTFPVIFEKGEKVEMPERKAGNGLTEYIIRRGEPILIEDNSQEKLSSLGVDVLGSISKCWLGVPMMIGNQPVGAIAIESYTDPHAFDFHTRSLMVSIAGQSAIALENARLFAETTRRNEELGTLNEIISSAATTLNLKEILSTVLQKVIPVIGFDGGLITMYNPSRKKLECIARIGMPGKMPSDPAEGMEKSLCAVVFESKDTITIEDFRQGAPLDVSSEIRAGFHAYLGVPLEASGQTLGTLCGYRRTPGPWSHNAISLVRTIGRQIGFTIENANLFRQTQLRAEETAAINDLGRALASRLDLDRVLDEVYRGVSRLLDTTNFFIGLYDPEKNENAFAINVTESILDKSIVRLPADKGLSGYVVRTREQILITDGVEKWMQARGMTNVGEPAKSWMGLPLLLGDQVLGVMAVQDYHQFDAYDEHDLYIFSAIANQASIAIQNARLFEQIRASENRFRDVSTISGDYIWETDLEWKYTYVSERVKDIIGYTPEELLGKSDYQLYDPVAAERLSQKIVEGIEADGRAVDIENEVVFKDGRRGYMLTSAVPILGTDGKRIGYRGVDKDITERKYNENVQDALKNISESALSAPDLHTLLRSIHDTLQKLMPAKNMYIALYDARTELMTFPYYMDEFDEPMLPQKPGKGLTSYVLRTGKPLLATPEVYKQLEDAGEVKGGGTMGVDWLGVPLRSGEEVVGVIAVQTYTTDQRLTERDRDTLSFISNQVAVAIERKQSELELRALFASMTDVIIVYDKEGHYIRIAPTNPSRLFRPPDILLGKKITEVLPPETHEPFLKAIRTAIETGETTKIEYPLNIEDKEYWFDATVSKLSNEQVFWVARDITDRRNFEETLRRQNEYLATSAEIGRLVTSTLDMDTLFSRTVNLIRERFGFYHAAIFIIEENGFNAVLKSATGKAGEEMLKRGHTLQVGSRSIVGTVTSGGSPLVVNDTAVDPIHRPNPLLPDTRSEAAIPLRIGRRIIGALDIQSTYTDAFTEADINVIQTLADQIAVAIDNARSYELAQQAITEMRELDQLKSQFLANMSHELRTPLNSIIGFSRVILKGIDGPVTELQEQDLNAIYNSGQHLLRLINDILDLSKIDAGKMELAFDDVNLPELLQSVIPTVGGLIKDKPIKLIQEISPEIPILRADAMRIRQVMINLLSNAAKFTEQGSITISANVEVSADDQAEVVVKVTDTGPGISPEDQDKLFQPFSQVDSSPTRKTGGTGLGLSISRRLIELHGGKIDVISQPNQGSTFYFTLPLPQVRESKPRAEGLYGEQIVLAVDDDTQVISLYERYLQPQGYQVVAVTDPTLALERARQLKPFAITLDLMMPGRDGWTVLADLKNDPETREIPVIVCSILEEEEKGFSLGAADYLVKPILEDDLLNALGRLNKGNDIHNVLVIDDDPKDLRLISKILESGRFHPVQAQGGERGWAYIEKAKPDAVILDLFMPDLNGFAILEKLRSDPNLSDIPIIVVTGADLNPEQQKLLSDFGQKLLQKGALDEKELLSLLERALKRIHHD